MNEIIKKKKKNMIIQIDNLKSIFNLIVTPPYERKNDDYF